MPSAWALVPVKSFATAKSRLEGLLTRAECARLAEEMARDVLMALHAAPDITGIAVLGDEPRLASLVAAVNATLHAELPGEDYRAALRRVARDLQDRGARHLLVVPADLPTLSSGDVQALLQGHKAGISLCPASADGGTNALLLSPPTAIPFLYGPDSAARHRAAAEAAGIPVREVAITGFSRDVDSPEDLRWLLGRKIACATRAWLVAGGVAERLKAG
jgi:2-phospho-L-lactate guanylyltransferase